MPIIDIIIPAYNAARYLPAAIESVTAQTFQDWRITLVDDGSTDNTEEIVSPFIKQLGPRLQYLKQPNSGLPAARNAAIRSSSAEFLALLDADDIWLPNRLTESLKCFEKQPRVGLAYGFISRIDSEGAVIDTFAHKQKHAEGCIAPYIYMRKINLPCPTITFRRRCVDEVGLFDESLRATEDRDLWLRIALRYEIALVPHVIAHYRTAPNSMSTDPERMLKAQLQFIQKHYGAAGCGARERRLALSQVYRERAEALRVRRKPWAALKSSLRAVGFHPSDFRNLRTAASQMVNCAGLSR